MSTTLHSAIFELSEAGLPLQRADGSTPPGHNGPHGDPELPSRNTGHWLLNWSFTGTRTGERRFIDASHRAIDYLLKPERRPGGYTFHHRNREGKDRCNGLMGPAFSIESLAEGGARVGREDAIKLAAELAAMHPYQAGMGLWSVREIDGSVRDVDPTLNHQIWFAAAVAMSDIARGATVSGEVRSFVEMLNHTMVLRPNGRSRHLAEKGERGGRLSKLARKLGLTRDQPDPGPGERKREIAYHLFNLYPLALLRRAVPVSSFWQSEKLARALAYLESDEYVTATSDPEFVRPHIPAGFPLSFAERALTDQVFGPNDARLQRRLLEEQFARTFDFETMLMTKGSIDPVTQAARSYEMTRLADVALELPVRAAAPVNAL